MLYLVRITRTFQHEKIATGSLLHVLCVSPWPKIAGYCPGNILQSLPAREICAISTKRHLLTPTQKWLKHLINFLGVNRIHPIIYTDIGFQPAKACSKFQLNQNTCLRVIAIIAKCTTWRRERKTKNKEIFCKICWLLSQEWLKGL